MRLSRLPVSIKYLAIQRAKESYFTHKFNNTEKDWRKYLTTIISSDKSLKELFVFSCTKEGVTFWEEINLGNFDTYFVDYPLRMRGDHIKKGSIVCRISIDYKAFEVESLEIGRTTFSKICKIVSYGRYENGFLYISRLLPIRTRTPLNATNKYFRDATDLEKLIHKVIKPNEL